MTACTDAVVVDEGDEDGVGDEEEGEEAATEEREEGEGEEETTHRSTLENGLCPGVFGLVLEEAGPELGLAPVTVLGFVGEATTFMGEGDFAGGRDDDEAEELPLPIVNPARSLSARSGLEGWFFVV